MLVMTRNNTIFNKRFKVPQRDKTAQTLTMFQVKEKEFIRPINCWIIYTLKLENGCWYVGKTTAQKFSKSIKKHSAGEYSWFTAKNKPIMVYGIDVFPRDTSTSDITQIQNEQVLSLVEQYGKDFVRGGGYSQRQPSWSDYKKEELPFLNRES